MSLRSAAKLERTAFATPNGLALSCRPSRRSGRGTCAELAEHPFGTMKRGMDQGYFLLKGLAKVRGEFSLTVLAYNLKRVFNIVGVARLVAALA